MTSGGHGLGGGGGSGMGEEVGGIASSAVGSPSSHPHSGIDYRRWRDDTMEQASIES